MNKKIINFILLTSALNVILIYLLIIFTHQYQNILQKFFLI